MPGYPKNILVQERNFVERLKCVICHKLLRSAVQSTCGHRYCEHCIKEKISSDSEARCPACPADSPYGQWHEKEIYPDYHARKELKTLAAKCPNEGCPWRGLFQQYTEHECLCDLAQVFCHEPGCGKQLRRGDVNYHMDKDCPMRPVKCRNCGEKLPYMNMKKHNAICPKTKVTCQNCNTKMPREQLQAHQDIESGNCPNKVQRCPYATFGCTFTETSAVFQKLQNLEDQIKKLEIQYSKVLEGMIIFLSNQMVALVDKVETFENTCGRQQHQIQALEELLISKDSHIAELLKTSNSILERKVNTSEGVFAVLSNQVEEFVEKVETFEKTVERQQHQIQDLEEMQIVKNVQLTEMKLQIQPLVETPGRGVLPWTISEFHRHRRDAVNGINTPLYSPIFHTGPSGYKMRACIYLNGDKMGKGTHVSLYFVVMKGQYDNFLHWPFKQKVTFKMSNQRGRDDIVDFFHPDPKSSAFEKPTSGMNIASGFPCFVRLSIFEKYCNDFVKDGCLFVKVLVDISDLKE